jgi:putative transposase
MKKPRFNESQVVAIPKEGKGRVAVTRLTRKCGISAATYYHWKSKYAGAGVPDLERLRELEAENAKLKRMYADPALENAAIQDVLSRRL